MKLCIRADGNRDVATGHIMRCLTIADACRKQHIEVLFLLADETCRQLVEGRGFPVQVLYTDFRDMEQELPQLRGLLAGTAHRGDGMGLRAADAVLVDSYLVTEHYLRMLGEWLPVIYMDDFGDRPWPVRYIINYNCYATRLPYGTLYGRDTGLFLGSAYTPVRPMFAEAACRYGVQREVTDVMISTGGGDPYGIAERLAHFLISGAEVWRAVTLHILCGRFSPSYRALKDYAAKVGAGRLRIHSDVEDMAGLMAQCGLAVSATGSTIYELCAVGVPTVSFYFAENQRQGAEELDRRGAVPCAGNYAADPDGTLRGIRERLERYLSDFRLREEACGRMREIVDGRGAARLAGRLHALLGETGKNGKSDGK